MIWRPVSNYQSKRGWRLYRKNQKVSSLQHRNDKFDIENSSCSRQTSSTIGYPTSSKKDGAINPAMRVNSLPPPLKALENMNQRDSRKKKAIENEGISRLGQVEGERKPINRKCWGPKNPQRGPPRVSVKFQHIRGVREKRSGRAAREVTTKTVVIGPPNAPGRQKK